MLTEKNIDNINNVLNVVINLSTQINVYSYVRIKYTNHTEINDIVRKFSNKNDHNIYTLNFETDGFLFNEINTNGEFTEPDWYKIKNDKHTFVVVHSLEEVSARSLSFKQLNGLIRDGIIRDKIINNNIHFVFITNRNDIPKDNIIELDFN
jgi:hypothetical protein